MKKLIGSIVVSCLLLVSAQIHADVIGYWAFNENAGTTANDSSGNGNNGTFATSSYTAGQSGNAGDYALNSLGGSQAVAVPATGNFDDIGTNNQVTLSIWVYGDPVAQPRNNTTVQGMNGGNRIVFTHLPYGSSRVYWDSGNAACCGANVRLDYLESDPNNYEGRWNHYAFVKDGTTDFAGVYVNGSLAASRTNSTADLAGMTSLTLATNYIGYVDDVAIYSEALPAATVLAIATGQLADGVTYHGLVGNNVYTKSGAGETVFDGPNYHMGGTIIEAGRLRVLNTAALGTGPVTVQDSGQAYLTVGGTYANDFSIEGNGWTETAGQLGAIRLENGANVTGTVTLTNDARISTYSASVNATVSGQITGAYQLEKHGSGSLVLSGPNDYSGGTLVSGGRLRADSPTAFGTGTVTVQNNAQAWVNSTTVANDFNITGNGWSESAGQLGAIRMTNGTITGNVALAGDSRVTVYSGSETGAINGVISGGFNFEKTGAGTLTLNGDNTYTGTTTIGGGVLELHGGSSAYTYRGGNIYINNGSTLQITRGGNNQYWFNNKSFIFDSGGGGTIDTTSSLNMVVYGGSTVTTNGGTQNSIIGSSGINMHAGHTLNFNVAPGSGGIDLAVSTRLWNSGGVNKTGDGVLQLSANTSSYSGTTTVNGGTLLVSNTTGSGTGTGAVVVNAGTLGGTGTIAGLVTVNAPGTLAPGASPGILTVGGVTMTAGSTFSVELDGTTPGVGGYDQLLVTGGDVSLGGATLEVLLGFYPAVTDSFTIIDNEGPNSVIGTFDGLAEGSWLYADYLGVQRQFAITYLGGTGNDVVLTAVPEPSTLAMLLGLGTVGLLGYLRCRRQG